MAGAVTDHGDGKYSVGYNTTLAGKAKLYITLKVQPEKPRSPYILVLGSWGKTHAGRGWE